MDKLFFLGLGSGREIFVDVRSFGSSSRRFRSLLDGGEGGAVLIVGRTRGGGGYRGGGGIAIWDGPSAKRRGDVIVGRDGRSGDVRCPVCGDHLDVLLLLLVLWGGPDSRVPHGLIEVTCDLRVQSELPRARFLVLRVPLVRRGHGLPRGPRPPLVEHHLFIEGPDGASEGLGSSGEASGTFRGGHGASRARRTSRDSPRGGVLFAEGRVLVESYRRRDIVLWCWGHRVRERSVFESRVFTSLAARWYLLVLVGVRVAPLVGRGETHVD